MTIIEAKRELQRGLIQEEVMTIINVYAPTMGVEKKMATHSNILAWEIPWTEEPQSMGLQRDRHS